MAELKHTKQIQDVDAQLEWRPLSTILVAIVLTSHLGCGQSAMPPPVKVTYRKSLVGIGMVVQITNTSGHHLYNVKVVGRNFKDVESASVTATEHLRPHTSVEVGWIEFEAWVPVPGETIEVYCDDYALPKVSVVPDPE